MVDTAVRKELILSEVLHEDVTINKTVYAAIFLFNSLFDCLII